MKKLRFSFCVLLGVCILLAGCNDSPDPEEPSGGGAGNPPEQQSVTLQERLASAEDGDEIDITAENLSSTANASLSVEKAVTIRNGSAVGSTFEIKAPGVTFDGVSGVKQFIIAEAVGEGGFTVKNCGELAYLAVNGGGGRLILNQFA